MRYLCNLTVYITVEAATLIGLTFIATTSYIINTVMARKKRSSAAKLGAGAKAIAPPKPVETDTRPETSPYGSPACHIPFASPLTVPLDILKKSPRLQAAYENRLPELPTIPEGVGHVLVHYLHTGTYESLRPKPTETMPKQICELKTSIQAYAAARAYDLPDLMRQAEAKIDKYGQGLPLPALLEVARDAYPTLTEGDDWFLNYLRSRIRPHLTDPESLLGSNLLDQISGILSPHRVLLRTVLELFCEKMLVAPPALVTSPLASPITSPGSSRPVSPLPPMSPSLLEMRSRSIIREEPLAARKKAALWQSPDAMSEASWSPEPLLPETTPPQFVAKPVPEPQTLPETLPFADLGPAILDVVPPPGPAIDAKPVEPEVKSVEPEVEISPAPEVKAVIEPDIKADEPEVKVEVEPETKAAVVPEPEATVEPEVKKEEPEAKHDEPEIKQEDPEVKSEEPEVKEEPLLAPVPALQRERKDSGKGIELELPLKEADSVPEPMPELETSARPQRQFNRPVLREVDSGFWESPAEVEPAKSLAPSIVEIPIPMPTPAVELVHELDTVAPSKEVSGIDARDFAGFDAEINSTDDKKTETLEELVPAPLPTQDTVSEMTIEVPSKAGLELIPELEPLQVKPVEEVAHKFAGAAELEDDLKITPVVEDLPEKAESKEVEAQPEPEKVHKETVEHEEVAKPEPEPKTDSSDPVTLSDDAQPAGGSHTKETQPSREPGSKPAGKPEAQDAADTHAAAEPAADAKSSAIFSAKPAPEQAGAKTELDSASLEPCSAQVRQRSWKRRFLSLRYPAGALFGRGM